ncbi:unnamed protein product, partial [Sphacelaria rigidula]
LSEARCGFRPGRSAVDMIFVVLRVLELTREKHIPIYMCLIDLRKAYDSVDHSLLWKVLPRNDISAKMISIIRQFHDGMRACICLDSDETSEWFNVNYGLCQGCVRSPSLFSIFFAAVLTVTFDRFPINQQNGLRQPVPDIALATKDRLLKIEVVKEMLRGCVTWTIAHCSFGAIREAHLGFLLRCLNGHTSSRSARDYHILPYHEVLEITTHECIEAEVTTRTLLLTGRVVRMRDACLPILVILGVMVGGKTKAGRPAQHLQHCITEHRSHLTISATSSTQVGQDVFEWYRVIEEGAKM